MVGAAKISPDGSHIALGGFAIARNNTSVSHELIRQQKKDLILSQSVVGFETDLLVGAGLVKRLIMGGGSLDRFGPVHCVNRAREASRDFADDYSSLSITFRYLAGALGISFIPISVCWLPKYWSGSRQSQRQGRRVADEVRPLRVKSIS